MKYENIERSFLVRLTKEDNRLFEEKYKKSKLSTRSDFIRYLIRYGCVYVIDYSYIQEYNSQLIRIGTNINQIAHKVNSENLLFADEIIKLQEDMDNIWQLQKSMLSKVPSLNP